MVHKREGHRLDAWLAQVTESGLPELQSFAAGVEKDKDAVQAGLTWPINNGMVEGHVTKRQHHQTDDVWQGWLCLAPQAGAACGLERSKQRQSFGPQDSKEAACPIEWSTSVSSFGAVSIAM